MINSFFTIELICKYRFRSASRVYDVNSGKQTKNYKGTPGDDGTLVRVSTSGKSYLLRPCNGMDKDVFARYKNYLQSEEKCEILVH